MTTPQIPQLPYKQIFVADRRALGESSRVPLQSIMGNLQTPYSYLFFCPTCGNVWARCDIVNAENGEHIPLSHWQAMARQCIFHGDGSMWLSWDDTFCNSLPQECLRRELDLIATQMGIFPYLKGQRPETATGNKNDN